MGPQYTTEFFENPHTGEMPAKEFIDALADDEKAATLALVTRLEQHGRLPMPHAEHLEGKIWQLRAKSHRLIRLLYTITTGRKIILLNGFIKKTTKTPRNQIKLAQQYLDEYVN